MFQKIKSNLLFQSEEKIRRQIERKYKKEYERIQGLLEKANEQNAQLERELEEKILLITSLQNGEGKPLVNGEKTFSLNKDSINNIVPFDPKQRISKLG